MTDTEIKERTAGKALAKINALENSLEYLAIQKPYLAYTQEMIDAQISFKRRELTIWNHIALLNETTT
jgi:hypothetical protein